MTILQNAFREMIETNIASMYTALPATVVSVDISKSTCSVEAAINKRYMSSEGRIESEEIPVLANVPYLTGVSDSGSFTGVHTSIQKGDKGLVVFSGRSIDEFKTTGLKSLPRDARKYDVSDGVFIPGLHPTNNPLPSSTHKDGAVVINGEIYLHSSTVTHHIAVAEAVSKKVNDLIDAFNDHTHPLTNVPITVTLPGPTTVPGTITSASTGDVTPNHPNFDEVEISAPNIFIPDAGPDTVGS